MLTFNKLVKKKIDVGSSWFWPTVSKERNPTFEIKIFWFVIYRFFLNVCLFVVFLEALMKEQEQYMSLLQQLKDYDERLTEELAAKAFQEQEKQKLEVMPLSCFEIFRFPHCLTNYEMLIRDNSRGGSLSVTE